MVDYDMLGLHLSKELIQTRIKIFDLSGYKVVDEFNVHETNRTHNSSLFDDLSAETRARISLTLPNTRVINST